MKKSTIAIGAGAIAAVAALGAGAVSLTKKVYLPKEARQLKANIEAELGAKLSKSQFLDAQTYATRLKNNIAIVENYDNAVEVRKAAILDMRGILKELASDDAFDKVTDIYSGNAEESSIGYDPITVAHFVDVYTSLFETADAE